MLSSNVLAYQVIIAVASALQLLSASVMHPSKLVGSEIHKYAVAAFQGLLILL